MLLLGILSVLQLILVPGLLLIRLFPGRRSAIQQMAFVFVLSLLASYVAVVLLTALGWYFRSVVLVLFALQVLALTWLYRSQLFFSTGFGFAGLRRYFATQAKAFKAWIAKDSLSSILYVVFAGLAALALLWILQVWVANFGTVFDEWDSWASWDRWAEKWADNRIPGDTWEYPQLIPILLSISYKFIGTVAVKFFGKSIMPLFAVLAVLALIDLGRRYRSFGYLLAASLALYSFNFFLPQYFWEVYVDIPVAGLSVLAVVTLLQAHGEKDKANLKALLSLGSLTTAVAAITKQTGVYILAVYPLFAFLWVLRERKDFALKESVVFLVKNLLLALAIVVPWYAFVQYNILLGNRESNIQYVISDIYAGQTLWERFVTAVKSLHAYAYWYLFLLLSLPVLSKPLRQLAVLVVLPFSILWAMFLSYEYRNLAIALPLLSLVNGAAVEEWVKRGRAWLFRGETRKTRSSFTTRPVTLGAGIALFLILLAACSLTKGSEDLILMQNRLERGMFNRPLNERLYAYLDQHNGPEPIITNYQIGWLPELQSSWRNTGFESFEQFNSNLARYDDASLLLVPYWAAEPIWDYLHQQIDKDVFTIEFIDNHYTLIRMLDRFEP